MEWDDGIVDWWKMPLWNYGMTDKEWWNEMMVYGWLHYDWMGWFMSLWNDGMKECIIWWYDKLSNILYRYDGLHHWIVSTELDDAGKPRRRNCKMCAEEGKKDSKALFLCEKCHVPLHSHCFKESGLCILPLAFQLQIWLLFSKYVVRLHLKLNLHSSFVWQ